jgi:hypothetical protein
MGFFFPTLFLEINTVFLSRGAPFKKLLTGTYLFLYVWSSIVSYSLARCICSYTIVHSIIHNTKHDNRATRKTFREKNESQILYRPTYAVDHDEEPPPLHGGEENNDGIPPPRE